MCCCCGHVQDLRVITKEQGSYNQLRPQKKPSIVYCATDHVLALLQYVLHLKHINHELLKATSKDTSKIKSHQWLKSVLHTHCNKLLSLSNIKFSLGRATHVHTK